MRAILIVFLGVIIGGLQVSNVFAVNHQSGLHLQLLGQVIDIKKNDIIDLQVFYTSSEKASALLRLSPELAEKVHKATEKEVGHQILWIWNGRVVSVQELTSPLSDCINVPNLTSFEAENMSKQVSN